MRERGKRRWTRGLAVLLLAGLPACGQDLPFDYDYKSARQVEIVYNGKSYLLSQGVRRTDTPFSYQFEADGDVDITIDDTTYEIDSPYDSSGSLKKKKKKKVKKRSSSSRKKR